MYTIRWSIPPTARPPFPAEKPRKSKRGTLHEVRKPDGQLRGSVPGAQGRQEESAEPANATGSGGAAAGWAENRGGVSDYCRPWAQRKLRYYEFQRKILREEVVALKEKEAVSSGRERALQDQQKSAQLEMEKMRTLVRKMQSHLQLDDIRHRESIQRMNETTESLREELRTISENCQQMQIRLK